MTRCAVCDFQAEMKALGLDSGLVAVSQAFYGQFSIVIQEWDALCARYKDRWKFPRCEIHEKERRP